MTTIKSFGGKSRVNGWMILKKESSPSFRNFVRGKTEYDSRYNKKLEKFFIQNKVEQRRVAIDVGASYGFVTEYLSQRFDEVKSFEVVPQIRQCLEINVDYREMDNVEVFPCGLADEEKTIDIWFNPLYTGHSSAYMNDDINREGDTIECEVRTLDSFQFENVDFLKIDVEGAELDVLRGGMNTIETNRPIITTEHAQKTPEGIRNSYEVITLMDSLNYRYVKTICGDFVWVPEEF